MVLELHECHSTLTDYAKGLRSVGVETQTLTIGCFEGNRDRLGPVRLVLLVPDRGQDLPSGRVHRALAMLQRVPAIAVLSARQVVHPHEWFMIGAHVCVPPPTTYPVLARQIRVLMDLSAETLGARPDARDLTRIERRILELISSRPGQPFSRSEILQHIYDDHRIVCPRTVDAHVKNLRRKLPDRAVVRSVYGEGYAFEAGPCSR